MNLLHPHKFHDEAALIRGLKNDSVQAFDAIYDMYFRRVYAYCYQFSKSRDDAADMVQEIFIKLWCCRHDITVSDSLHPLIYRIARNGLISRYRLNLNSPRYEEYLNYRDKLGADDYCMMEYEEFVAKIESCIEALPPAQNRILRMSKFQSMTIGEIAQSLGIGEQTVRNQLSAALKTLRSKLGILTMLFY